MSKESGVLLHISSLPGKYGIGTIGESAYEFVDFLADAGFSYWEILPIHATGYSSSPYQVVSAFGYNYYLIDFDLLIKDGLLTSRDLKDVDFSDNPKKVNFDKLYKNKKDILRIAYKRFLKTSEEGFQQFCKNKEMYNFCLYQTIKGNNKDKARFDFQLEDRYFDKEVKKYYETSFADEIKFNLFIQFIFEKQRKKLKAYANSKNIDIIGDISHFVGYDSDVMYFNPELFMVDKRNLVTYVAGFPPDEFRKEGQKWGYPLYDWDYQSLTNFKWWNKRLMHASQLFDRIKLNHFRGFYKVYAVPFRAKNARKGKYLDGPGSDYINEIKEEYNIISSDLGKFNKDIESFVKETNIPKLRVSLPSLFAEDSNEASLSPDEVDENTYLYLENHDNLPIKGYFDNLDDESLKNIKLKILDMADKLMIDYQENLSLYELSRLMMKILFASKAEHVTLTMQDILYSGKQSRMNEPGVDSKNNWTYRFLKFELNDSVKNFCKELNIKSGRINKKNFY